MDAPQIVTPSGAKYLRACLAACIAAKMPGQAKAGLFNLALLSDRQLADLLNGNDVFSQMRGMLAPTHDKSIMPALVFAQTLADAIALIPDSDHLIEVADHVHHTPTGEDWVVRRVAGDRLEWCGWPAGSARLSDCKLIKKATLDEKVKLMGEMQ